MQGVVPEKIRCGSPPPRFTDKKASLPLITPNWHAELGGTRVDIENVNPGPLPARSTRPPLDRPQLRSRSPTAKLFLRAPHAAPKCDGWGVLLVRCFARGGGLACAIDDASAQALGKMCVDCCWFRSRRSAASRARRRGHGFVVCLLVVGSSKPHQDLDHGNVTCLLLPQRNLPRPDSHYAQNAGFRNRNH